MSDVNFVEQVKEDERQSIFREFYRLAYVQECNGIAIIRQSGTILTRQDFEELVEAARQMYEYMGDDGIDEYNERALEALYQDQSASQIKPAPKPPGKPGWVYIIEAEGQNLYKIGITRREPTERLADFSPKLPWETKVLYSLWVEGDVESFEKWIHGLLSEYRRRGEWFELPRDMVDSIIHAWKGEQ